MKRAKTPDKAQGRAQVPDDTQMREKGVTLTRLDVFRMNMKMRMKRSLPQGRNHMILRTTVRIR